MDFYPTKIGWFFFFTNFNSLWTTPVDLYTRSALKSGPKNFCELLGVDVDIGVLASDARPSVEEDTFLLRFLLKERYVSLVFSVKLNFISWNEIQFDGTKIDEWIYQWSFEVFRDTTKYVFSFALGCILLNFPFIFSYWACFQSSYTYQY